MKAARIIDLLYIILFLQIAQSDTKTFLFGLLFPWEGFAEVGSHSAGAVTLAVEEINNDTVTFPMFHKRGHRVNFTWADTKCDVGIGLPIITDMYFNSPDPVDFFIGPGCSVICEPGGHLATDWKIPMISWGATSSAMSNKAVYPTFARTAAPNSHSATFFTKVLLNFDYNSVAIFYSSNNVWSLTAMALKYEFDLADINISVYHMFQAGEKGKESELSELKFAKTKSRGKCLFYVNRLQRV